jgi:hypothetical protein
MKGSEGIAGEKREDLAAPEVHHAFAALCPQLPYEAKVTKQKVIAHP